VGRHQAENATVALAVGLELGLDVARMGSALERVALPHGRCEILTAGHLTLINDTYNANPVSLAAALEVARSIRGNRRLVVLVGTMLELGVESGELHEQMAHQVLAAQPDLIGAVGEFVPVLERRRLGPRLVTAPDAEALGRQVAGRLQGDELVLLKASRGVQMEKAIPPLVGGKEATCSSTS
jgi:UDP-N-acetylmuramoyl-tripeptide--D-alanyl-D-alanine ligase